MLIFDTAAKVLKSVFLGCLFYLCLSNVRVVLCVLSRLQVAKAMCIVAVCCFVISGFVQRFASVVVWKAVMRSLYCTYHHSASESDAPSAVSVWDDVAIANAKKRDRG